MPDTAATLVMSASTRVRSINAALARTIVAELIARGEPAELVDLVDYDMPMYHGDHEADHGPPDAAAALVDRFTRAGRIVITSPEYNGAFPPLLKNTFDWMSRVDRRFLVGPSVHLASASPGSRGGMRGLAVLRLWLEHMHADVAEDMLSVPSAGLTDDGALTTESAIDLEWFLPARAPAAE